ncbi:MAG: hypothetical protein H0T84_14030 [Tatlockia sp.]|nr:hypothetical protein [Tatlockia sp.]
MYKRIEIDLKKDSFQSQELEDVLSLAHGPQIPSLDTLPRDLLKMICFSVNIQTVFQMKIISKQMAELITPILVNIELWGRITSLNLNPKQIASFTRDQDGYKKLISFSTEVFEENFSTNFPYKTHNYYTKSWSFFREYNYKQKTIGKEFSLKKLLPLILDDNAATLFSRVSRLKAILGYIQEDNFDLIKIKKFLARVGDQLKVADLCFIGLLPNIIKFGAKKSFDVFVKAYLALLSYNYWTVNWIEGYSYAEAFNLTYYSNTDYFINRFIELTIRLYPIDYDIGALVNFASKRREQVLIDSIKNLPQPRKSELLTHLQSEDRFFHLINEIEMYEEYSNDIDQTNEFSFSSC